MISMILGRKIGMTQVWDDDDNVVPVTVIQAGPCAVSQVKTQATDGYDAVQIGFGDIKAKHVNKPMAGHFAKAGVEPVRYLREVRVENGEEHKVGDTVTVADFENVAKVDVIGTSVSSQESVVAAIVLAHHFVDRPFEALCQAASVGGDTDTVAAIAGAMLGATADAPPAPAEVVDDVLRVSQVDLASRALALTRLRDSAPRPS